MDNGRSNILIGGRRKRALPRERGGSPGYALLRKQLRSPFVAVMAVVSILVSVVVFSLFPREESVPLPGDVRWFLPGGMPASELSFRPWFESWGFALLLASVGIALVLSLAARFRAEYARAATGRAGAVGTPDPAGWPERVMKILLSRRFRMVEDRRGGEVVLRASKGGSGVSGSILFHASLLMLVIGVFLGRYASMEATVALTEGQVFDASTDRFGAVTAGRFYAGGLSGLRFSLAAVDPAHVSGGASTAAVRILDLTGAGTAGARVVHVNRSASVSGFTLHLGTKTGYAPYIRVKNDAGRVLLDGFTRLAALGGGSLTRHRDLVWLEGEGSFLEAELLPGDGDRTPRSREAVPVLKISLHRMGAVSGPLVLLPGQTGDLMGHAVTFGDVRRWAHVDVSDDPSLPFLLIACLLGTAGLLVRLLWVRKEIVIRRRNHDGRTVFLVSGSAEKYPESFREEVLHIVGDIQAAAPSDVYIQHAAAAQAGTRPGARATVGGDA